MATPEQAHIEQSYREYYGFEPPAEETEINVEQLLADTRETVVRSRVAQARHNHYGIQRHGQAIGEAVVTASLGEPSTPYRIQTAKIESIGTDPSNDHSVLLAVIRETIASYPYLTRLDGEDGLRMARVAPDLEAELPEGWEYASNNRGIEGVIEVGHVFKKIEQS